MPALQVDPFVLVYPGGMRGSTATAGKLGQTRFAYYLLYSGSALLEIALDRIRPGCENSVISYFPSLLCQRIHLHKILLFKAGKDYGS